MRKIKKYLFILFILVAPGGLLLTIFWLSFRKDNKTKRNVLCKNI